MSRKPSSSRVGTEHPQNPESPSRRSPLVSQGPSPHKSGTVSLISRELFHSRARARPPCKSGREPTPDESGAVPLTSRKPFPSQVGDRPSMMTASLTSSREPPLSGVGNRLTHGSRTVSITSQNRLPYGRAPLPHQSGTVSFMGSRRSSPSAVADRLTHESRTVSLTSRTVSQTSR